MDRSGELITTPAWDLESQHSGPLLRLERLLRGRTGFTLVVLEYSDSVYRDRVMTHLEGGSEGGTRVDAREARGDFAALEDRLARAGREHQAVQVTGLEDWPHGLPSLWRAFNYHREQIADRCPAPVLLWILRDKVGDLALEAPDFWAWRSGVFDFGNRPATKASGPLESPLDRGRAPKADRGRRIAEIDAHLARLGEPSHPADLGLLIERGELLRDLGDLAGALESFQTAAAGYESGDDRRGEALAKRRSADVLATRGDPARALRLLREESLPVYDQLGDVRERAITMGQIADILQSRGELDEALRIRREEELPVYDQLGDVRSRAIAGAKLGLLLARMEQPDEGYELLHSALRDAERLKIPEAETIRDFLAELVAGAASRRPT